MIGTFYTAIGSGSSGRVPVIDISTNGKNHRTFFLKADGTVMVSGLLNYTCGVGEAGYINNWKPKNKFFQGKYWSYAEIPPYVHELLWDPEDPSVIEFPHSMVAHYDVFTNTGIKASEIEKTILKTTNAKTTNTPVYVMASSEEILTGVKQVKTCNTHTLFLKRDGTVWICGKIKMFTTIIPASNSYVPDAQERMLAPEERARYPIYLANTENPGLEMTLYPVQVYDSKGLKLTNVVSIEATSGGSYFVKDDGSVWGIGVVTGLGNKDNYTPEIPKNTNSLTDLFPDGIEDRDKNLDKNLDQSKEVAPPVEKIYATNLLTRLRNEDGDYIKNVIEVKSTGNSVFFITKNENKNVIYVGGFNNRGEFGIPATNPEYNPYSKNKTDLQYNGTLEGFSRPDYALRALHTWCPWTASVWKNIANSPNLITDQGPLTATNTHWPLGTAADFRFNRATIVNYPWAEGSIPTGSYFSNGLTLGKSFCDILEENVWYYNTGLDKLVGLPVNSRKKTVKEDYCGLGYQNNENYKSFYLSRSLFPPKFELIKTLPIGVFSLSGENNNAALGLVGNSLTYNTKGAYPAELSQGNFNFNLQSFLQTNLNLLSTVTIDGFFLGKYELATNYAGQNYVLISRQSRGTSFIDFSASRKIVYKQNVQTYSILPNWASLAFHDSTENSGINSTFLGAIQNSPGLINIPTVSKCLRSIYDAMVDGDIWGQKTLYQNISNSNIYASTIESAVSSGWIREPYKKSPTYSLEEELLNNPNHNKYYLAKNEDIIFPIPYEEMYEKKTNFNIPFVFDVIDKQSNCIFTKNYQSTTLNGNEWEQKPITPSTLNSFKYNTKIAKGLTDIISKGVVYSYSTPSISQLNFYANNTLTNNITALSAFNIGSKKSNNVNNLLKNGGTNVTFGSWEYAIEEAKKITPVNWNSIEQKRNSIVLTKETIVNPLSTNKSYNWQQSKDMFVSTGLNEEHNILAAWSIRQNPCIWLYSNHAEKINRYSYDDLCSLKLLSSYPVTGTLFNLNSANITYYTNASYWQGISNWKFLTVSEFLSVIKPEDTWSYYGELQNARSHLEKTLSASVIQRPEFYIRGFYNLPIKLSRSFDKVVSSATGWYCNWDSFFADVRQYMEPQWVHPYYYDYSLHALENYTKFNFVPGYGPRTTYNRNHTTWFLSGGIPTAVGTNESGQWGNDFNENVNVPIDPDTYQPLSGIIDIAITTRVLPWMNRIHNALETNLHDYRLAYGEKALFNANSNVIIPNFDNNYYKEHANSNYTSTELYRWWALASYKKGYISLSKLEEAFEDNSMDATAMGLHMLESPFSDANNIKLYPYLIEDKLVLNYQQNYECLVYEIALNNKKGFVSLPTNIVNLSGCQILAETDLTKFNATIADVGRLIRNEVQGPVPILYQNIKDLQPNNFTIVPLISSSLGKSIQSNQTIKWITLVNDQKLFFIGNISPDTVFYRELKAAGTDLPVQYPSDDIVYLLENPILNLNDELKTNCNINLPFVINQQVVTSALSITYNYYEALFDETERITDQITISPICWDFNFDEYPEYQYIIYIDNGMFTDRVDIVRTAMNSAQALRLNYWLPVSYSLNSGGHCHFGSSTYFLKEDGSVLSCGSNEQGQLGYGYKGGYGAGVGNNPFSINMSETTKFGKIPLIHSKPAYVLDPTGLKRLRNIVKIYAAYDVVYFINNVGEVYSCGANYFGEQGTGSNAINSQTSYLPSKVLI